VLLGQVYQVKCIVINIDAALGKVCRVQEARAINESAGQACVAGAVGGFDHSHRMRRRRCGALCYCNGGVPSGNRPINRGEEEQAGFARGQQKSVWLLLAMVPVGVPSTPLLANFRVADRTITKAKERGRSGSLPQKR